jgi:hypothetical protein
MTTATETTYVYSGLQAAVAYALNTMGRPKGVNTVAYTGVEVYAAKLYGLTLPGARRVPHVGNDRLLKTQIFAGQEPASGELSVGAEDLDLIAVLTNTVIKSIAGMKMLPHMTDLQGSEPNVGLILYQAALSRLTSAQGYHFHMIPSTKAVPRIAGAGAEPIDTVYDLAPNPSEKYLWGAAMAPLSDPYDEFSGVSETGALESGVFSGFCEYEPRIAAFVSGASTVEFLFPGNMPAASVDRIAVFTASPTDEEAVEVTVGITKAVTGVTFDTTPGLNKEVILLYQKA